MLIAALFIVAPKWKLPKYPSAYEWMNQFRYVHTM